MSAVAHIKTYKTGQFYTDAFRGDMSWNGYERNVLLRNDGHDTTGTLQFTSVGRALGADEIRDARGVVAADFDNDGDLDLVIHNNPGDLPDSPDHARATLLRNDLGTRRSWIAVELQGTTSNRDGVGALVTVNTGGSTQVRHAHSGSAYASQQSARLYFGLKDATQVDQLTVRWPSGTEQRFEDITARRVVQITEGSGMKLVSLPQQRPAVQLSKRYTPSSSTRGRTK